MKTASVSNPKAAVLGIQHLLAMYAGAVAVPLLIGTALNFSSADMTYLISIDIFMCGLATLLQLTVNRFFGIGLPVVLGCAIQAVSPLILIGQKHGIGAMYGSIMVAGLIVIVIAGFFSKVKNLFPPIVTGSVITVIGLSLIPVAFDKIGGGSTTMKDFGDLRYVGLGFFTILLIIVVQLFSRGFMRAIAVLIGLIGGTLLAAAFGMLSTTAVQSAPWVHVPQPFYFGMPTFDWSSILLMVIISLVSMVESTGVYFALADLTDQELSSKQLAKGYRAEGLAVLLGGIFNTFPYTGFSQNVGLVQLSKIRTRKPIYFSAVFLILMGLLPKVGAIAQMIPEPVLGGGMFVMFGMVAMQGIRTLSRVDFQDDGNLLVVAVALALGIGSTVVPTVFQDMPQAVQMFTQNGIVMTSIAAVLLNQGVVWMRKKTK